MKPLLPILGLLLAAVGTAVTAPKPKKNIGPCQPYAEVCKNCVDCSACKHCSLLGGKCSVCFKR